ncbi:MAG: hypothetical protein WC005_03450 [Candidatus Nanopelagicales bacterium]
MDRKRLITAGITTAGILILAAGVSPIVSFAATHHGQDSRNTKLHVRQNALPLALNTPTPTPTPTVSALPSSSPALQSTHQSALGDDDEFGDDDQFGDEDQFGDDDQGDDLDEQGSTGVGSSDHHDSAHDSSDDD